MSNATYIHWPDLLISKPLLITLKLQTMVNNNLGLLAQLICDLIFSQNSRFGIRKILTTRPGGSARQPHPRQPQPHPPSRPHSQTFSGHQPCPPNYSPSTMPQRVHPAYAQTVGQQRPIVQQQHQHTGIFSSPSKSSHRKGTFTQVTGRPEIVTDKMEKEQELKTNPHQVCMALGGSVCFHFIYTSSLLLLAMMM